MLLILIFVYSLSIININGFQIVKNNESITIVTNKSIQLSSTSVTDHKNESKFGSPLISPKIPLGGQCNYSMQCKAANSFCRLKRCDCYSNYKIYGDDCTPIKVPLGGQCNYSMQCKAANSICRLKRCDCDTNYKIYDDDCTPIKVPLGGRCNYSAQCSVSNSMCKLDKRCYCKPDYEFRNGNCILSQVPIGGQCVNSMQCKTPNSLCFINRCICKDGYHNTFIPGGCFPDQIPLGGDCSSSIQCKALNSYCSIYGCRCSAGYEIYGDICRPKTIDTSKNIFRSNSVVIAIIVFSVGVIFFVAACRAAFLCRKNTNRIPPARQNEVSIIHPPPEYSSYQNQNEGFNAGANTVEPNFHDLDKPPSYEDVMNSFRSTNNLLNYQVPSSINPNYGLSVQNTRSLAS